MGLLRCIYVSTACLDSRDAQAMVQDIVEGSIAANDAAQVTGALMFDGSRFAQLLEGPEEQIVTLVDRITNDRRHKDVVFIERKRVTKRLFDGFAMAYSGNSVFVERSITRSLADSPEEADGARQQLIRLMLEFAR